MRKAQKGINSLNNKSTKLLVERHKKSNLFNINRQKKMQIKEDT